MVFLVCCIVSLVIGFGVSSDGEEGRMFCLSLLSLAMAAMTMSVGEVMQLAGSSYAQPSAIASLASVWVGFGLYKLYKEGELRDFQLPDRCHFCESLTYGEDFYFPREDSGETIDIPACSECQERRDALRAQGALRSAPEQHYTLDRFNDNP